MIMILMKVLLENQTGNLLNVLRLKGSTQGVGANVTQIDLQASKTPKS